MIYIRPIGIPSFYLSHAALIFLLGTKSGLIPLSASIIFFMIILIETKIVIKYLKSIQIERLAKNRKTTFYFFYFQKTYLQFLSPTARAFRNRKNITTDI